LIYLNFCASNWFLLLYLILNMISSFLRFFCSVSSVMTETETEIPKTDFVGLRNSN
jgi:hypothetical protein